MTKARAIAVAPLLLLAACHGSKPDHQDKAAGQILPGSASDAMLPLETVTSQPPYAPRAERAPETLSSDAPDPAASSAADAPPAAADKPAADQAN